MDQTPINHGLPWIDAGRNVIRAPDISPVTSHRVFVSPCGYVSAKIPDFVAYKNNPASWSRSIGFSHFYLELCRNKWFSPHRHNAKSHEVVRCNTLLHQSELVPIPSNKLDLCMTACLLSYTGPRPSTPNPAARPAKQTNPTMPNTRHVTLNPYSPSSSYTSGIDYRCSINSRIKLMDNWNFL